MEGLSELGLDTVEDSHCFGDTVEGQNTCPVVQVHSFSGGHRVGTGSYDGHTSDDVTIVETIQS